MGAQHGEACAEGGGEAVSDTTNDIDALLGYLSLAADHSFTTIPSDVAAIYHSALAALVAERDALRKRVPLVDHAVESDAEPTVAEHEADPVVGACGFRRVGDRAPVRWIREVSDTWARRLVHKDQIINRLRYEHELKEKQNVDNGLAVVNLKRRVEELERELCVDTSAMLDAMPPDGGGA